MTFRLSPSAAARIRAFLADYAGKPLYLKSSTFAEAALLREVERLELVASGALPPDRARGDKLQGGGVSGIRHRPINAHET